MGAAIRRLVYAEKNSILTPFRAPPGGHPTGSLPGGLMVDTKVTLRPGLM